MTVVNMCGNVCEGGSTNRLERARRTIRRGERNRRTETISSHRPAGRKRQMFQRLTHLAAAMMPRRPAALRSLETFRALGTSRRRQRRPQDLRTLATSAAQAAQLIAPRAMALAILATLEDPARVAPRLLQPLLLCAVTLVHSSLPRHQDRASRRPLRRVC